jgi:phage gpG-like protein
MTLTLQVDSLEGFGESLRAWAEGLRIPVQEAMANRLQDITQGNFGDGDGIDRPFPWQKLSRGYADKAHGGDTTPTEVLLGDLHDSIQVDASNPEFSRVFSDLDYAPIQQWGGGDWNIPARPFFPLIGDETSAVLTPYAEAEVRQAAMEAIEARLKL